MTPARRHTLLCAGVVQIFVAILLCGYAWIAPRRYVSTVQVELRDGVPEDRFLRELDGSARSLGGFMEIRKLPRSSVYEIAIYDSNPGRAAMLANNLALELRGKLERDWPPPWMKGSVERHSGTITPMPRLMIWQLASPASRPRLPHLFLLAAGGAVALAGVVCLICSAREFRRDGGM